eukprot:TRINITY_DN3110_c0_g1_i1.p1 TRINITY_DN3110_c0_g1~~TRINITY_DN3110_c0_g1_i1.p1  ORF type:complete len:590 (+),score=83.64 TRINITY_DN3110_c0_g1_i1:25-1770(+)
MYDFLCHYCPRSFTSEAAREKHERRSHSDRGADKAVTCGICLETYSSIASLSRHHEKRHTPYRCRPCGMRFETQSEFDDHCDRHSTDLESDSEEIDVIVITKTVPTPQTLPPPTPTHYRMPWMNLPSAPSQTPSTEDFLLEVNQLDELMAESSSAPSLIVHPSPSEQTLTDGLPAFPLMLGKDRRYPVPRTPSSVLPKSNSPLPSLYVVVQRLGIVLNEHQRQKKVKLMDLEHKDEKKSHSPTIPTAAEVNPHLSMGDSTPSGSSSSQASSASAPSDPASSAPLVPSLVKTPQNAPRIDITKSVPPQFDANLMLVCEKCLSKFRSWTAFQDHAEEFHTKEWVKSPLREVTTVLNEYGEVDPLSSLFEVKLDDSGKSLCPLEGCTRKYSQKGKAKAHVIGNHSEMWARSPTIRNMFPHISTVKGKLFHCPFAGCKSGLSLMSSVMRHIQRRHVISQSVIQDIEKYGLTNFLGSLNQTDSLPGKRRPKTTVHRLDPKKCATLREQCLKYRYAEGMPREASSSLADDSHSSGGGDGPPTKRRRLSPGASEESSRESSGQFGGDVEGGEEGNADDELELVAIELG